MNTSVQMNSQSSVLPRKGRLVKGTEETKQRMAELRAIKQQKKIAKIAVNERMAELRAIKQQKRKM